MEKEKIIAKMMNRPTEIEEALEYLDDFDSYDLYMEAWSTIYEYIEQLEETVQDLSSELASIFDDGK